MPHTPTIMQMMPASCVQGRHIWRACVPLVLYHVVEWHHPDRVMQQFGLQQHIPDMPLQQDELHDISLTGKQGNNWPDECRSYIHLWDNRNNYVVVGAEFIRPAGPNDNYMRWYFEHSIPHLTRKCVLHAMMVRFT